MQPESRILTTMKHTLLSVLGKLCLLAFTCILALGMLEIALNITSPEKKLSVAQQLVTADVRGDTIHTPNLDTIVFSSEQQKTVHIRTNAEGFVGNNYAVEKPTSTTRIAILGDSFVAALQVDTDKNFVSLLEKKMQQQYPAKKFEVMNFGVGGQGTIEELFRYEYYVKKYHPDYTFVIFFPNDFENNQYYLPYTEQFSPSSTGWLTIPPSHANNNQARSDWKYRLMNSSYLVRKLDAMVKQNASLEKIAIILGLHQGGALGAPENGIHPSFFIYEDPLKANFKTVYHFTTDILTLFAHDVQSNSSTLTVVYLPEAVQVDSALWTEKQANTPSLQGYQWNLQQPNTYFTDVLKQKNISYLDITPMFTVAYKNHPTSTLYNGREGHLNEQGHEALSDTLLQYLKKQL